MKVAILQFDIKHLDREGNIHTIERLLDGVECDLVILPEMFATGYCIDAEQVSEPAEGATYSWMKRISAEGGFGIMGSVAVCDKGNYFNRMYIILPDGTTCHYDKRHLFTFAGEERTFARGTERVVVEWKGVRILPLICYDLRFPVWSYLPGGVDLIVYSASWAASRAGAWDTLLPARAVENQAWVAGVNRTGIDHEGTPYNGHSAIYDHLGRKVADCGESEQVVVVELQPEKIAAFREKFRAWQDADQFQIR
ncbi:MAG: nitrilase family protein [Tidjanibacter sp.]|nr:nitrilase family protein [Tidjanibacter sp.]